MSRVLRIAVVGDVHGVWDSDLDNEALKHLKPDVTLFVGDFGDENVAIAEEIAKLTLPKAVILGNHDCCYSAAHHDVKSKKSQQHVNKNRWVRVEKQLQVLGDSHVGYKRMDFDELRLSVIGVRPFAKGGEHIYNNEFISRHYGVDTMDQSAKKIAELALSAPKGYSLVFLGHNGPTGLGTRATDICGNDFDAHGGDHGDPDLTQALKIIHEKGHGKVANLVVFGHMHRALLGAHRGQQRNMCAYDGKSPVTARTVYVNAAVVPRSVGSTRHFTLIEMDAGKGRVLSVSETWVDVSKNGKSSQVASEKVLFSVKQCHGKKKAVDK